MPNEVVNSALPSMYSGACIFFLGFLVTRCVDWVTTYFKQPRLQKSAASLGSSLASMSRSTSSQRRAFF